MGTVDTGSDQRRRVLIFDGDCGFCTTAANYVVAHSSVPIAAVAWQLADLTEFGVTREQVSSRVYFIDGDGTFAGHRAFASLLTQQKSAIRRFVGRVLLIPPFSWLAWVGYSLVARFRHRLPGGTPACAVSHDAHE